MNRHDITELHYIVPVGNLPSIMEHGILSHNRAAKVAHGSVAMEEIQTRRQDKKIPGAGNLHDYANLYFDAHNPMLSRFRARNSTICVLRVNAVVLDLPGVIIADCNASSDYVHFQPVAEGLAAFSRDRVLARYWTHPDDPLDEIRHKSQKCAEVLVPECVDPCYILGVYVANAAALASVGELEICLSARVKSDTFF
jgi:hypothetical protein